MNKVVLTSIAVFVLAGAAVAIMQVTDNQKTEYKFPGAAETAKQYFESWNKKDWVNMYATLSDGFKKIDPSAKDFAAFRNFAGSQGIESINILSIKEFSNDGATALIDYSVEFVLSDRTKKPFNDRFSLKYRQGDIIPGWKLVHPYGLNIDTS